MNLMNDPWIPVVYEDNRHELVTLEQIFSEGEIIRDIEVRPQDRIALMRLFLCIAQGCIKDWPIDIEERHNIDIYKYREIAVEYLKQRKHLFGLFDLEKPFLQVPDLINYSKSNKFTPLSKLDLCLATGNNPTVFDNLALDPNRYFSPATIALNLLTFQCMSPPGLSSQVEWKGKITPKSTHGSPFLKAWHIYIQRENILETIYSNCIQKRVMAKQANDEEFQWGVPIWDMFPTSMDDTKAWENAQNTYIGRLVFLSSLIKIDEKNNRMIWGKPFSATSSLKINSSFIEPSIPYTKKQDKDRKVPLLIDLTKGSWRDLAAIIECSSVTQSSRTVSIEADKRRGKFYLWIGGLKNGDTGKSAKIEASIESYFYIPEEIFDPFRRHIYQEGIKLANHTCNDLRKSAEIFLDKIYNNKKFALPNKFILEKQKRIQNIVVLFYEKAQARLDLLFNLVKGSDKNILPNTPWSLYLYKIQQHLFFTFCQANAPREYLAYEFARKNLHIKDLL